MGERVKIEIMDTTLRDGEQTSGVSFVPHEKLMIARLLLEDLKVDRVEVASARVSDGEMEAVRMICDWAGAWVRGWKDFRRLDSADWVSGAKSLVQGFVEALYPAIEEDTGTAFQRYQGYRLLCTQSRDSSQCVSGRLEQWHERFSGICIPDDGCFAGYSYPTVYVAGYIGYSQSAPSDWIHAEDEEALP